MYPGAHHGQMGADDVFGDHHQHHCPEYQEDQTAENVSYDQIVQGYGDEDEWRPQQGHEGEYRHHHTH